MGGPPPSPTSEYLDAVQYPRNIRRHPPVQPRLRPLVTADDAPVFNACLQLAAEDVVKIEMGPPLRRFIVPNYRAGQALVHGRNPELDAVRNTHGDLIFPTEAAFQQFVAENCARPGERVFLLRYDVSGNQPQITIDGQSLTVERRMDQIRYVEDQYEYRMPFQGWTFWDGIPDTIAEPAPGDSLGQLQQMLIRRYAGHLCHDNVSRHKLGWFLVYWMLNRSTPEAHTHMLNVHNGAAINDARLPGVALINHALNIYDLCIGLGPDSNPLLANGMFQPFIRGFVDDPTRWVLRRGTADDSDSVYLQLPDDPNDALASVLRAHPNTFLVRFSPTKAFHLDCLMYKVVDKEADRRQRRKYEEYVVFFSLNLLQPDVPMTPLANNCPAPLLLLVYLMNHMHEVKEVPGAPGTFVPHFFKMSLLLLLDRLMRQKTFQNDKLPADVARGPIMANYGSARAYYASVCTDPAVVSNYLEAPPLSRIPEILNDQKPLFDHVMNSLFEADSLDDSSPLVPLYRGYLETAQFCDPLFATIDNFGDPGCSVSPTWMTERIPETPPNALMNQLYEYVLNNFYSGSLWECERTAAGSLKEDIGWSPSAEGELRRQHIWHLMRWLGMKFFVKAMAEPEHPWVVLVSRGLRHVLNASYAYPFISPDMAENMLAQLGPAARKAGFVLRLSTSIPLAFEQRMRNPNYDPQKPYMAEFTYKTVKGEEWQNWLSGATKEYLKRINAMTGDYFSAGKIKNLARDIAIKTPLMHQDYELTLQMEEYLLRRGFFRKYDLVLVRNLQTIEQYLASCNVNVAARLALPYSRTRYAFRDASNEEELERLDLIVEKAFPNEMKAWKEIKTLTLSVNARGEGTLLGLVADACRPGTFARLNFEQLHRPLCDDNPSWLLDQPLLTNKFLDELVNKTTKKNADDRALARALQDTVTLLRASPAFAENWCTSGRRGDRNLSVVINWLSYDTVKFVATNKNRLNDVQRPFVPETPSDWESLLALNCITELSADPVFHLLVTPPEADVLACTYPGFAVVSLSASTPRALLVTYVDPASILEIHHTEIDMNDLRPLYRPDFSLALLVRLMVFQMLQAHLAPAAAEVSKFDQAGCRKTDQARPTGEAVYNVNVTTPVTNQYASQILTMLLSVNSELDPERVEQWYTSDQERWHRLHPWTAKAHGVKVGVEKLFGFLKAFPGRAWQNMKNVVYNYNQWWVNPTNYWYGTETVEGADFTGEIQPLINTFLSLERQYAQENFVPTDIPSLTKRIGADEEGGSSSQGLTREAIKYREKEFRGEAFKTERDEKAFKKDFKAAVFGPLAAARDRFQKWRDEKAATEPAPLSTAPDTIYDDLRFMQRLNPPAAAQRLHEKIQSGEALGPGEIKIGIQLGLLDERGQLLQRGMAPQFMPRVTVSAGPMSDRQVAGPPLQAIKDPKWKDFHEMGEGEDPQAFLTKLENFEREEGCAGNGPDYVFPAFDVDSKGRILPRCGRPGWMSSASGISKDQYERLDSTSKRLLVALRNIAKHWCPTPAHELRLWRWIGIGCLGRTSVEVLADLALEQLDDTTNAQDTPVRQLSEQSKAEQRKLIDQFRERATRSKSQQSSKDVCKKRVLFLQQMISSNILFPYIPDSKNARVLAGYNPERVVIMLGWGKSGSVVAMRDGRKFLEHEYQAEDLVEYMQYVPTTVRLRIFHDFYGGLAANNFDFYTRVLHQAGQQKCLKSLADMKRFAVRAALSLSDQRRLDEVYGQVQASNSITPEQRKQLEELQNISLLLQAKNLSTTELYIYEEIRKLEGLPATDKATLELAERLYKSKEVDVRLSEAEQFEALALCQRPEFVPYLRQKLKEKYPELSVAEIEAMDREHLCRVLINNPGVEQMKLPVLLWQIKNVPVDYRNDQAGGLLDLWTQNPSQQAAINSWLMKNYGITLQRLRDDNRDTYTEEVLSAQAQRFREEAEERLTSEARRVEDLVVFRDFLTNGARCPYTVSGPDGSEVNLCEQTTTFLTTDGQSLTLQSADSEQKSTGVLDLFSIIYANFCHPAVPLLMNDFEFILQSFNTLKNYFALRKYSSIPSERRLDKQCKVIQHMYNKLMDDARRAGVAWRDFPLYDILKDKTIKGFYQGLRKGIDARTPLRYAWGAFARKERKDDEKIAFAMAVLLVVAEVNGLVTLSPP